MTIAHDFTAQPTSHDGEAVRGGAQIEPGQNSSAQAEFSVPLEVREERLTAQLRSFERAGYRVETRAGLQAIVAKPREHRPVRDTAIAVGTLGLALIPAALGVGRRYHRVVITVDTFGAVRLA